MAGCVHFPSFCRRQQRTAAPAPCAALTAAVPRAPPRSLGLGNPYKRDTGLLMPATDPDTNNGSKVMDCDGAAPPPGPCL
jgi:hypothetical protein